MNRVEEINQALFLILNAGEAPSSWIMSVANFLAVYAIWVVPLILLGMWFLGDKTTRQLAVKICLVIGLGLGMNELIQTLYHHPRPFMIGIGHTLLSHRPNASFPSDHATILWCMACTLFLGGKQWLGAMIFIIGGLVGWARIFLGVHFPLDMAGAVLVSLLAWLIILPVWHYTKNIVTRHIETE